MNPQFWLHKWDRNEIGFHQDRVNPLLVRHWSEVAISASGTVFVPLCGKSLDMVWLRSQGYRVVGVEISPVAVKQFFSENRLAPQISSVDGFVCWDAERVRIYQGDFFDLEAHHVADITVVYDRASLIALPPERQEDYAKQLRSLVPRASILLISLDYDPEEMEGPPFSTDRKRIDRLFGKDYQVALCESMDALSDNPALQARGLCSLREEALRLTPKRQ